MIKINLAGSKKQLDLTNVGGFDFTKIKIKALVIVLVLIYVPDFVLVPMWEKEREEAGIQLSEKQRELGRLKGKINQASSLEKQIRELKNQEEMLGQKLLAVKKAISEKRNPSALLLYMAKNIPKELWIKELVLDGDVMNIKGEALDYTSIGSFINNLKSSVFIKEANIVNTASVTATGDVDKKRTESFEVRFTVGKFEQ